MYLHFENWSDNYLAAKDRHGEKYAGDVVKVYASPENPRLRFGRTTLRVIKMSAGPFLDDEVFDFSNVGRRIFTGEEIEHEIASYALDLVGESTLRTLFMYAHTRGLTHSAMTETTQEGSLFDNPLQVVNGMAWAVRGQADRLHLKFMGADLPLLQPKIDFNDPSQVLSAVEGVRYRVAADELATEHAEASEYSSAPAA